MPLQSILFQMQIALKKMGIHIDQNQRYLEQEAVRVQRLLQKAESVVANLDIIAWNPPIPVKITRYPKPKGTGLSLGNFGNR